jgi:hypothetical protein
MRNRLRSKKCSWRSLAMNSSERSPSCCETLDCVTSNDFLRAYYTRAGFEERGEIEARFPPPVGALRLQRHEKQVR